MITNTCFGSEEIEDAVLRCIIDGFSLYNEFFFKVFYLVVVRCAAHSINGLVAGTVFTSRI